MQQVCGEELIERFGVAAARLRGGRIEEAHFVLTAAGACHGGACAQGWRAVGAIGLDAEGIDARHRMEQHGLQAPQVDAGASGPLQLGTTQLAWRADGAAPSGAPQGRGCAPGEHACLIGDHAQLRDYVPEVRGIAARGRGAL